MHSAIYIYIYILKVLYIYIYIYIERERERERVFTRYYVFEAFYSFILIIYILLHPYTWIILSNRPSSPPIKRPYVLSYNKT